MENTRFNTRYKTFTSTPKEEIAGASETLPDETLSIPEILARYVRQGAQNVDTSYPGVTTEDDLFYDEEMGLNKPQGSSKEGPESGKAAQETPGAAEAENSTK